MRVVINRTVSRRVVQCVGALVTVCAAAARSPAQAVSSPAVPSPAVPSPAVPPPALAADSAPNVPPRTVANLVIGDAAVIIRAATQQHVYVGVATAARTSTVMATAPAVDEFVGETQAIVRLGTRKVPPQVVDRPVLQEGSTGRALSVTRHMEKQKTGIDLSYHFFVSDDRLNGYAVPATPDETKAFLLALHRAARVSNSMSAPPPQPTPPHPRPRATVKPS
jgi:hypothetical protein